MKRYFMAGLAVVLALSLGAILYGAWLNERGEFQIAKRMEERRVTLYLDAAFGDGPVGVHPNDNTATVWLKAPDLVKLIGDHGNPVIVTPIGD